MDATVLRNAFLESISNQPDAVPTRRYFYCPSAHVKALREDSSLVQGIRGAGKSVWWALLQDQTVANIVYGRDKKVVIRPGFGVAAGPEPSHYPGPLVLEQLLHGFSPHLIWRAVILSGLPEIVPRDLLTWAERTRFVGENPEQIDHTLHEQENHFQKDKTVYLILFDALDRTILGTNAWTLQRKLLNGLLQNVLDFRSSKSIRLKVFVRPDMLEGPEVGDFPDASKVLTSSVDLRWTHRQLFGLLWQHLLNGEGNGVAFRELCETQFQQICAWVGGAWEATEPMKNEESLQQKIFECLAGPRMGKNHRGGHPYTWLPRHLSDADHQASPRSFLAALRKAAELSQDGFPTCAQPLHHETLKKGCQHASSIRVAELKEDFDWIEQVMEPLRGLKVPCAISEIEARWKEARLPDKSSPALQAVLSQKPLSPTKALCDLLTDIKIFDRLESGRINVPDVYRVGFGLLRLGGVKALR